MKLLNISIFSSSKELSRFESSSDTRSLSYYVSALTVKEQTLLEEAEYLEKYDEKYKDKKEKCVARLKYDIVSKYMLYINGFVSAYNNNDSINEKEAALILIQNLKKTVALIIINEEMMKTLLLHRNNRRYYANMIYAGGMLTGGILLSTIFPESLLASIALYYGSYEAFVTYLKGFDNFVTDTVMSLVNFFQTLDKLEAKLKSEYKEVKKSEKTLYEVLGVQPDASSDEINKRYKKLSLKYHPDKNPATENLFKEICEAKDILMDNEKRRDYDLSIGLQKNVSRQSI